jgi:MFS family permease
VRRPITCLILYTFKEIFSSLAGSNKDKNRSIRLITLIIAGETVFFLPFVLVRIFRPTLLAVFEISNTELGTYFSAYGLVAMISYVIGGTLADRFQARNLMALALWLTSVGGMVMFWIPSSFVMKLLYVLFAFTSVFLFWAAMIRATREWGGTNYQGRAFSWLEGGRGATAAILGTLAFLLFSQSTEEAANSTEVGSFHPFQIVIFAVSIYTLLSGFLVWYVIPVSKTTKKSPRLFEREKIRKLFRLPKMWMLSVIIVCAYIGYKITDDYSLFAKEVMGYSEVNSAGVGTAALWMRALVAFFAGFIADRFSKVKLISLSYIIAMAGGLLIGFGVFQQIEIILIINLAMTMVGVYGIRALYFAVLKEARIPFGLTGTAVGIVSFIGYTPDIFWSPLMGYILDSNPGPTGHQYVFLMLAVFSFVGLIVSFFFARNNNNSSEQ